MKTEINWAAASALAAIFSLASMPAFAQSILVSAESGNLVPIDGVWEFPGCSEPDFEDPPEERFDQREYLIYDGNTIESLIIFHSSTDGSCTGDETIVSEKFPIQSNPTPQQSLGWGEIDDFGMVTIVAPPLCQDPAACPPVGLLNSMPFVTETAIDLGNNEFEIGYQYIDDTGDTWYLYRNAGEDDAPTLYMSPDEPLRKVDIVFEPRVGCEIELSQDTYVDGDTIMANVFRLSNPTAERVALEVKVWLGRPDETVRSIVNIGAYGFFRVPAETDIDLGPLWLGKVWPHKPRGEYELNCRVLDPKTGERIAEDLNEFVIE